MLTRPQATALVDEALGRIIGLGTTDGWPPLDDIARSLRERFDDVRIVDALMGVAESALYVMHRRGDRQMVTLVVPSEGAQFSGADLYPDGSVSRFNGTFYA